MDCQKELDALNFCMQKANDVCTVTADNVEHFGDFKTALIIGFGVLVVCLVVLGIIIAFNKMRDDDDDEFPLDNDQAYY